MHFMHSHLTMFPHHITPPEDLTSNSINIHIHTTVCHCIIVYQQNFLLLRRSPHDTQPNTRWLPGGGREVNEDVFQTIQRELSEEAGLHQKRPTYIASYTLEYPASSAYQKSQRLFHTFLYQETSRPNIVLNHEHTAYARVPLSYIVDPSIMQQSYKLIPGLHSVLKALYPTILSHCTK